MAGVRDNRLFKVGPWPRGINNTAEEGALPENEFSTRPVALREADNVDLTAQGRPRRRRGRTRLVEGTLVHSLWAREPLPFALFVDDGVLQALYPDMTVQDLGVAVGNRPLSYALINDRAYFTNTTVCGLVTQDAQAWGWGPDCPLGQPAVEVIDGFGLPAGLYQVAVTFTDLLGRESGASVAVQVDVHEGAGLYLSALPRPSDLAFVPTVNIYLSDANDQVLRLWARRPSATEQVYVTEPAEGKALDTMHLVPLPAGQIVRGGHGRQWVASANQVYWSPALRYGLFNPARNRMRFHAPVDMLEPIGDGTSGAGVYVATGDRVLWFDGADPADFRQATASAQGVVPGSSQVVSGSTIGRESEAPAVIWLGKDGVYYAGLPGGQVSALTEGVVADGADRAAVLLREEGGMSQFIAALRGRRAQAMGVSDRAYAHVVHRDAGT